MKNDSRPIVSKNIRYWRKKRGMTQAVLADRAGKTTEMISQMENAVTRGSMQTLDEIANVLDIDTYQLFLPFCYSDFKNLSTEQLELISELKNLSTAGVKSLTDFVRENKNACVS